VHISVHVAAATPDCYALRIDYLLHPSCCQMTVQLMVRSFRLLSHRVYLQATPLSRFCLLKERYESLLIFFNEKFIAAF